MRFSIDKISSFYCSDKFIRIYDESGLPFYQLNNKHRIKRGFNLPAGTYNTTNELKKGIEPIKFRLPILPKPEKEIKPPHKIKIVYDNNPNKCSVYLDTGLIVLDHEFEFVPKFIKMFILFHEIGHYNYSGQGEKSEANCDKFATVEMIKRGFNPSQCQIANKVTLSSDFRHKACQNFTKKIKKL